MPYIDDLLADRRAELKRVRDEKQQLRDKFQQQLARIQAREDALIALIAELEAFIAFQNS